MFKNWLVKKCFALFRKKLYTTSCWGQGWDEGMCWSLSQRIHTGQVIGPSFTYKLHPDISRMGFKPMVSLLTGNSAKHCTNVTPCTRTKQYRICGAQKLLCNTPKDLIYGSPVNPEALLTERSDCVFTQNNEFELHILGITTSRSKYTLPLLLYRQRKMTERQVGNTQKAVGLFRCPFPPYKHFPWDGVEHCGQRSGLEWCNVLIVLAAEEDDKTICRTSRGRKSTSVHYLLVNSIYCNILCAFKNTDVESRQNCLKEFGHASFTPDCLFLTESGKDRKYSRQTAGQVFHHWWK